MRRWLGIVAWGALLGVACAAPGDAPAVARAATAEPSLAEGIALERVVGGLESPVYLAAPPQDARLFVVEQPGRIRIVRDGRLLPRPFLDLTDRVKFGGERGLLSVAFHPRYATNRRFYVNYTDLNGDTRVVRFTTGDDPNAADRSSARLVIMVEQPYSNHNGGHILFGPDGMLYIGMGDGGSGGDPHGHGQNRSTLLGDLLRIDVDRGEPYAIPPDNPFMRRPPMRGEIWAWGLRNPWRLCFDPPERKLYIADVGQNEWEEIHVAGDREAGLNYGWNRMEGNHCYRGNCDTTGLVRPLVEYPHSEGCSITGGFVYRGRKLPDLVGHYFYADYCHGWIRSFRLSGNSVTQHREWRLPRVGSINSFGLDGAGELYVLSSNGGVYRIEPSAARRSSS